MKRQRVFIPHFDRLAISFSLCGCLSVGMLSRGAETGAEQGVADVHPHSTRYIDAPAVSGPPDFSGEIVGSGGLIYRITLTKDGDLVHRCVIEGGLAEMENGSRDHAEAGVDVNIRTNGVDVAYEITVTPKEGYGVFAVEYPILTLHPISGAAYDRLLVPEQSGTSIPDPFRAKKDRGSPHRFGKFIWYGTYGSSAQTMQFILYENGRDGVMIWTQDGEGRLKDFEVSESDAPSVSPEIRATIHHYPSAMGKPGTAWKSPYPTLVSRYSGGWVSAAKKYRAWAITQPWCADGGLMEQVRSGKLPAWYARSPIWLICINEKTQGVLNRYKALFPGVEFSVFLTQWQRHRFDYANPEYFPPNNEQGYRELIAMQPLGFHFFPYMNMQLMDMTWHEAAQDALYQQITNSFASSSPVCLLDPDEAARVPHYVKYEEYWGTDDERTDEIKRLLREAWSGGVDERLIQKIQSDWFVAYAYEKKMLVEKLRQTWGRDASLINSVRVKRRFKPFCRFDAHWREFWVNIASRNLLDYGTDGQYFDQSVATVWACWSASHGHPPGLNEAFLNGTRALIVATRDRAPGKVFCGEGLNEYYTGLFSDNHAQHPEYFSRMPVPLFQSVYHGYVSQFAWSMHPPAFRNMNDFAAAFSLMLHVGYKIGFSTIQPYLEILKPEQEYGALAYVKQAVDVLLATMESVCYGERLADPVVRGTPWHEVTYFHDSAGAKTTQAQRAVVEASCWRSLDGGKTALLLTHSGDRPVEVTVSSADIPVGATLRDVQNGTLFHAGEPILMQPFSLRGLTVQAGE
ncbi:MAG: DUF6259 domain-containing protein [Kiritimatiellia bacterium]|nr:DUF6259 domain-containing protein [Kiritimatiellia bacterium]